MKLKLLFVFYFLMLSPLFAQQGLSYEQTKLRLEGRDVPIYLLVVDPNCFDIRLVNAFDQALGRETVLSIAKRYGAVAAINGGFFKIGGSTTGQPSGALKVGEWIGLPSKPRGSIGWSSNYPLFDRLDARMTLETPHETIFLDGLNRERKEGEAILYNSLFHRTTMTTPAGEEWLIVEGRIQEKKESPGNNVIEKQGVILSIDEMHPLYGQFFTGMPVTIKREIVPQLQSYPEEWEACTYVLGGTPLLIYEGKACRDHSIERVSNSFLHKRHARTALGVLPTGEWLFVVVDRINGRGGMTIDELTDYLLSFGCRHALNLDGGGSSTLVYDDEVKNSPEGDEDEGGGYKMVRRVSNAIIIQVKES